MGLIGSYLGVLACSGAGVYTSPNPQKFALHLSNAINAGQRAL